MLGVEENLDKIKAYKGTKNNSKAIFNEKQPDKLIHCEYKLVYASEVIKLYISAYACVYRYIHTHKPIHVSELPL